MTKKEFKNGQQMLKIAARQKPDIGITFVLVLVVVLVLMNLK